MIKAERQSRIKKLLETNGTVSVKEVSDFLGVSDMTVRRDLEELSAAGVLERVHGGARRVADAVAPMLPREYSNNEKRSRNTRAKRSIAERAVELIKEHDTVFLGPGTTVEQMALLMPAEPLRVVTNSLSVFNMLEAREDFDLCLVGGIYRRRTAAFVGPIAEDAVGALGIDVAFIGVNGIYDGSVYTSNMEEGRLQRLVLDKASRRYLVGDASKFGRRDFYAFYGLDEVTGIISDAAPETLAEAGALDAERVVAA